jgi:hypothetical protein
MFQVERKGRTIGRASFVRSGPELTDGWPCLLSDAKEGQKNRRSPNSGFNAKYTRGWLCDFSSRGRVGRTLYFVWVYRLGNESLGWAQLFQTSSNIVTPAVLGPATALTVRTVHPQKGQSRAKPTSQSHNQHPRSDNRGLSRLRATPPAVRCFLECNSIVELGRRLGSEWRHRRV